MASKEGGEKSKVCSPNINAPYRNDAYYDS